MPFVWTEALSVQVKEIDEQHQQFFKLVNDVLSVLDEANVTKEHAEEVLRQLNEYAQYHLTTEEKYFDQCHYPDAEAHLAAHNAYRETVAKALEQIHQSQDYALLIRDITLFAGRWLTEHIRVMDQEYVACFHECGIH